MELSQEEEKKLRAVTGRVYSTETFGTVDGPGIRYVLFLQGCPLKCLYCHNVDSLDVNGGKKWTAGQVVDEIMRYNNFIRSGGVTFSGGEPFMQPEFLLAMIHLLQKKNIHTAIDTAGCVKLTEKMKEVINKTNLLLLDIKSINPEISKELSGQTSELAFKLLDYCESIKKPVWIRQVLVKGFTLEKRQLTQLAEKLRHYLCIELIELLPFHKLGEPKWGEVNRPYLLKDVPATTKEETEWAKEIFEKAGFQVQ